MTDHQHIPIDDDLRTVNFSSEIPPNAFLYDYIWLDTLYKRCAEGLREDIENIETELKRSSGKIVDSHVHEWIDKIDSIVAELILRLTIQKFNNEYGGSVPPSNMPDTSNMCG